MKEVNRADALVDVAERLPNRRREPVINEALEAARTLRENIFPPNRTAALCLTRVSEHLPKQRRIEVLYEALGRARSESYSGGSTPIAIATGKLLQLLSYSEAYSLWRDVVNELEGFTANLASFPSNTLGQDLCRMIDGIMCLGEGQTPDFHSRREGTCAVPAS